MQTPQIPARQEKSMGTPADSAVSRTLLSGGRAATLFDFENRIEAVAGPDRGRDGRSRSVDAVDGGDLGDTGRRHRAQCRPEGFGLDLRCRYAEIGQKRFHRLHHARRSAQMNVALRQVGH